jgi:hypothetical protein
LPGGEIFGRQVGAHQELQGRIHPFQFRSLPVRLHRPPCSDAEEDRLIALGEQIIQGQVLPDADPGDEADAQLLQVGDLLIHDGFGQFEGRDAVAEEAAGLRHRLEDRHRMALAGQELGHGEPGRAGAHHRGPPAGGRRPVEDQRPRPALVVGHEGLQGGDLDRLAVGGEG